MVHFDHLAVTALRGQSCCCDIMSHDRHEEELLGYELHTMQWEHLQWRTVMQMQPVMLTLASYCCVDASVRERCELQALQQPSVGLEMSLHLDGAGSEGCLFYLDAFFSCAAAAAWDQRLDAICDNLVEVHFFFTAAFQRLASQHAQLRLLATRELFAGSKQPTENWSLKASPASYYSRTHLISLHHTPTCYVWQSVWLWLHQQPALSRRERHQELKPGG